MKNNNKKFLAIVECDDVKRGKRVYFYATRIAFDNGESSMNTSIDFIGLSVFEERYIHAEAIKYVEKKGSGCIQFDSQELAEEAAVRLKEFVKTEHRKTLTKLKINVYETE